MFTVKVNEQANGFTAMTADELFFIHHTVDASANAVVVVIPGLPPFTIITGDVKYKYEK